MGELESADSLGCFRIASGGYPGPDLDKRTIVVSPPEVDEIREPLDPRLHPGPLVVHFDREIQWAGYRVSQLKGEGFEEDFAARGQITPQSTRGP